ncbi:MAG: glycosyltransferase 87 family protein [Candidatus Dormibacteria bacterium]
MAAPPRTLSWKPRRVTASLLAVAIGLAAYLFSPLWWSQLGFDSRDLYSAGRLAATGGNPYDPRQLFAQQDLLYGGAGHLGGHVTYGYDPLFTRVLALASGLPEPAFYLLSLVLVVGAAIAAMELLLLATAWKGRGLPRLFFLVSVPVILTAFVGNVSTLVLLAWAAALWLGVRGRPLLGGMVLALSLLKLPVGLPAAIALLLTAPIARRRAWVGFGAGCALLLVLEFAVSGAAGMGSWWRALTGYAGGYSSADTSQPYAQTGLVGIPALLLGFMPTPVAVVVAMAILAAILRLAGLPGRLRQLAAIDTFLPLALVTSAALLATPYIHLNDLALETLPVLVVASHPLTRWGRACLALWATGAVLNLVIQTSLALAAGGHPPAHSYGFGVLPGLATLFAVTAVARSRKATTPAAASSSRAGSGPNLATRNTAP